MATVKRRRSRSRDHVVVSGLSPIFGYQEIFLRIMSYLSPTDLATVQSVNKQWAKMSLDPQLWKRLYLERYPHPHHSRLIYKSGPGTTSESDPSTPSRALRPIARLPSRAFPPPSPTRTPPGTQTPEAHERIAGIGHALPLASRAEPPEEVGYGVRNDGVDWKMMLRLGTNWSNGNALSEASVRLPPSPAPTISSISSIPGTSPGRLPPPYSEQHIALFPSFIVTSNPTSPLVHVHRSSVNATTAPLGIIPPPPGWSSPSRPDNVTSISADQSVSLADDNGDSSTPVLPARLGIFYQSGGFAILRINIASGRLSWEREAVSPPHSRPRSLRRRATLCNIQEDDPIILTALHYPVIITCTLSFHLSFFMLTPSTESGTPATFSRPRLIGTMHSDVSFHPAALTLLPIADTAEHYRAALTYCTPLYPCSWTVAVQEFNVAVNDTTGLCDVARGECWHVGRGDEDEPDYIWPKRIRPVAGVKGRPVGVGTDGRWAVLAGEDNQIQVYSLPSHTTIERYTRTYPISHSHTLLAHSAAITSISLASGRVVSGGRDGRVLVWELDEDVDNDDPLRGRTVAYVEVRPGGRRAKWRGAAGPHAQGDDDEDAELANHSLPHPQSISSAARSLFLPRLPQGFERREARERDIIRQLAFDEEKIVGLIRQEGSEVMKVWGFNG